jgi:uncharacterized protein YbbC (DUF1343 family)
MKHKVKLGIEKLLEGKGYGTLKIGLLCNQASVNHFFQHAADLFCNHKDFALTTLYGPQHGIRGDVQDNMIETAHAVDAATRLPIYSLYSETREPTAEMLADVDVLICDLFDVGCRIYTFVYTIANCMRVAGRLHKKVVVCDRPNPINGICVEGNLLEPEMTSFVGLFPIPTRHGLTVGELALMFQKRFGIQCDLEVIKMDGWRREFWYDETDAPWVMPSPNMPTLETATVFPGTVIVEGTQLSEGRGTTRPFELNGAPFIEAEKFAKALNDLNLPGVYFRASNFQPTFQKHAKVTCGGVQIHVLDRSLFKAFLTGVAIVSTARRLYPNDFQWKTPPYEYVWDKNPFDVINGTTVLRQMIEQNASLAEMENWWKKSSENFVEQRKEFLLY